MRLRWFGHIYRIETENWVKKCRSLIIDGAARMGRPRKTWNQVLQNDLQLLHLETVMDEEMPSRRHRSTQASMERTLNEEYLIPP